MKALSIHLDMRETASEPDVEAACAWPFAARSRTDKEAPPSGFFSSFFFLQNIFIFFPSSQDPVEVPGRQGHPQMRASEPGSPGGCLPWRAPRAGTGWHGLAGEGRSHCLGCLTAVHWRDAAQTVHDTDKLVSMPIRLDLIERTEGCCSGSQRNSSSQRECRLGLLPSHRRLGRDCPLSHFSIVPHVQTAPIAATHLETGRIRQLMLCLSAPRPKAASAGRGAEWTMVRSMSAGTEDPDGADQWLGRRGLIGWHSTCPFSLPLSRNKNKQIQKGRMKGSAAGDTLHPQL